MCIAHVKFIFYKLQIYDPFPYRKYQLHEILKINQVNATDD